MYFVYILLCGDGSLYTGLTTDPARRLAEHTAGSPKGARYTRQRQPLKLIWQSESLPDRRSAAKLEYQIKDEPQKKLSWIARERHESN